jgi:hypothetical protein
VYSFLPLIIENSSYAVKGRKMDKKRQYEILENFFIECVRYWERELNTDSDLDKQPYINAIKDIPMRNPYVPCGEPFDEDVLVEFIKHRKMDCYGNDWMNH